jgi:transposase
VDETDASPAQDPRLRSHHLHFEWSYKRLEKGRFRWPETTGEEAKVVLSHEELALLLGGIDLTDTQRRQWYRREMTPVIETQIFA